MSLSILAKKCRVCPYVDTCDHKEMEAFGFLPEPKIMENASQPISSPLVEPLLRETMEIRVDGKPVVVYKDDILEQLRRNHYEYLGLPGYLRGGA